MVNRSRVKTVQTGMQDDNGHDVYSNRTRADLRKLRRECKAKDKQLAKQFQDYMSITDLENFDDPRIIGAANLHFQNKLSIAKIFAKSKYMADDKNAEAVMNEAVETFGLHSVIAFGNKAAAKLKGFNQSVAMAFQPYVEKMCEKHPSWKDISEKVTAAAMGGRYPLKPDFAADMRIAWDIKYHNDCIANKNDPDKLKELKEQYNSNIEKLTVLSERDGVDPADLSKAYSSRIIERMTIDPSIKNIYNNMALGYTMQLKSEPVIDKETGKQAVDRNGNKGWKRPTEFVTRNGDPVDAWNDISVSEPPTIDSVVRLYNDRFTQLENDSPEPKNVRDVNAMLNSNSYKGVEDSMKNIIKYGGFSAEERKELKYKIEYAKREMLINYGEMYDISYLANLRHMKPWDEVHKSSNQIGLGDTYTDPPSQEGSQKPVNLDKLKIPDDQKPVENISETNVSDKKPDDKLYAANQDNNWAKMLQEHFGRKLWDNLSSETKDRWYKQAEKVCSYVSMAGDVADCVLPDSKIKKYVDFVKDRMKQQVQAMESHMVAPQATAEQLKQKNNGPASQTTEEQLKQKNNGQAPQTTEKQSEQKNNGPASQAMAETAQSNSKQYDSVKSLYDMKKQIDAVMANEDSVTWTDKKGETHTTPPITVYVDKGGKEYTDKQTGETKTTKPSMSIMDHRNGGSESYSVIPYEKDNKPDLVIRDPNKNYINKTDLEKYDDTLRACLEVPANGKGRLYVASKGSVDKEVSSAGVQAAQAPQAMAGQLEQKDNVQAPQATVSVKIDPADDPKYNEDKKLESKSASGTHIKIDASKILPSGNIEDVAKKMAEDRDKKTEELNAKAAETRNCIDRYNKCIEAINVPEPVNTGVSSEYGN